LRVSLQEENQALKEANVEKNRAVEKLVKSHQDNEKLIENLRGGVEEDEK